MGGRGASLKKEEPNGIIYGTEYKTIVQVDNIKFVRGVLPSSNNSKAPYKTSRQDRIYVTVKTYSDELSSITTYNKYLIKATQIDLSHKHNNLFYHAHDGEAHGSARPVTQEETDLIVKVNKIWENTTKEYKELYRRKKEVE